MCRVCIVRYHSKTHWSSLSPVDRCLKHIMGDFFLARPGTIVDVYPPTPVCKPAEGTGRVAMGSDDHHYSLGLSSVEIRFKAWDLSKSIPRPICYRMH